jgi:hypothetical protein
MTPRITAQAIMVLGLKCPGCEEVSATDWRFYTRSECGLYQDNAEDVSHLSNDLVGVCERLVLNDKGI